MALIRDFRIPKPICLTLFIALKVQTFCTLIIFMHDFTSQAFFSLVEKLKISLEVPQDKAKKGVGLEKANIMNCLQFSTTVWSKVAKNILTMFEGKDI